MHAVYGSDEMEINVKCVHELIYDVDQFPVWQHTVGFCYCS